MSALAQPSRSLILRLADEIERAGAQGLLPYGDAQRIAEALRGRNSGLTVQLMVPIHITLALQSSLADLRFARCSECGAVYNLTVNPHLLRRPRCDKCGRALVPAPVWSIVARNLPASRRRLTTKTRIKIALSIEEYRHTCPQTVKISDRARPIATLEFNYGGQKHRPSASVRRDRFIYWLSMMPSEGITKPISIIAFAYNRDRCIPVSPTMGSLKGIEEILFCRNLEVLQATVAYKAGHYRTATRARVTVMDMLTPVLVGAESVRICVRYIRTQGIVVRADKNLVRRALQSLSLSRGSEWVAVHTLSHAFLVSLPQITGLEGRDFGEALNTHGLEFAIYDNAMGGLGGIEGVVDIGARTLDPNYEIRIRESVNCPLACTRACKACLYTDSCYMLNWRLDRRVLRALGW